MSLITPWKFWPQKVRLILITVTTSAVLTIITLLVISLIFPTTNIAPALTGIGAAVIAGLSLSASTFTSYVNWSRAKRESTLKAWSDWVDSTRDFRINLSKIIGANYGLTKKQAEAICDGKPFTISGQKISQEESITLRRNIRFILGRLERLAVGIEMEIYDLDVIIELGGTLVTRIYGRLRPYITYLHDHPNVSQKNERAYIALDAMIANMNSMEKIQRKEYNNSRRRHRVEEATREREQEDSKNEKNASSEG